MAAEVLEYPKGRGTFFAYRLTRLMFKSALANEIGPEACYLISQIAHTEDATRYQKAVTFYNEQLMPVCGFPSIKALALARTKAIKSGWLVYIPGGKGKPGKYWTTIPCEILETPDSSIDESNFAAELQATNEVKTFLCHTGRETPDKGEVNARETPDNCQTNAGQTPDKGQTILPIPNPIPKNSYSGPNENLETAEAAIDPNRMLKGSDGTSVLYEHNPVLWEYEFVRKWNKLPGVTQHPRSSLSDFERRKLVERFRDPDWDWKTAMAMFPICLEAVPLSWLLEKDHVQEVIHHKWKIRGFVNVQKPKSKVDPNSGIDAWLKEVGNENQGYDAAGVFECVSADCQRDGP